jgi:hypothetical protein
MNGSTTPTHARKQAMTKTEITYSVILASSALWFPTLVILAFIK